MFWGWERSSALSSVPTLKTSIVAWGGRFVSIAYASRFTINDSMTSFARSIYGRMVFVFSHVSSKLPRSGRRRKSFSRTVPLIVGLGLLPR